MKYYIYNEDQENEIVHYLAEQEEMQQRDLGHLTGKEIEIDKRDIEILKDVLEAHLVYLYDTLRDCVVGDDLKVQYEDEQVRISKMLDLIDKEVEDETN